MKFYQQVPKQLEENLAYRVKIRKRAQRDEKFRRALWTACKHDVLYFFNAFCFLYEPRPRVGKNGKPLPAVIPFITWPHQNAAILKMRQFAGMEDMRIKKSRGEGASWSVLMLALHDWLFCPIIKPVAIGLVSRTEEAVDSADDPDSLMWKLDWQLKQLPTWMGGKLDTDYRRSRTRHSLTNLRNASTITGYAATGDVASGGRKTYFIMDEFAKFPRGPDEEALASTQPIADSRIFVSTPKGNDGAYYRVMHEPSALDAIVMHWKMNPARNQGMYRIIKGELVATDPENNPLPAGYAEESRDLIARLRQKGYRMDGVVRSPWYDRECDRPGATPQSIAQELDMDFGGSESRPYSHEFVDAALQTVKPPLRCGLLTVTDSERLAWDFDEDPSGAVKLWCPLLDKKPPSHHSYVIAADVAAGTGGSYSSNSVVCVVDRNTNEQVLEFATNSMDPVDFADLCICIAKWFNNGYLAWEHMGPGVEMTERVVRQRYFNVYRRQRAPSAKGLRAVQDIGWVSRTDTIEVLHREFSQAVRSKQLAIHSEALLEECGQYRYENGLIVHGGSRTSSDGASKGRAHGDRVIAAGIAWQAMKDRLIQPGQQTVKQRVADQNTMAWRDQLHSELKRKGDTDWDDRTITDLYQGGFAATGSFLTD